MKSKVAALFDFQGTIGASPYLITGTLAFAIKYSIDRYAATLLLHKPWMPWQYLDPIGTTGSLLLSNAAQRHFLVVMSAVALPFVWLGISLTLKRLRSIKAPLALVVLFFVPVLNLFLFLALSLIPARRSDAELPIREGAARKDALLAVAIAVPVSFVAIFCAAKFLSYGWGLFVGLPFCLGLISSLIYTWRGPHTLKECFGVAMAACAVVAVGLLLFAFEGFICIIMASPIAVALAALGAFVGFSIQPHESPTRDSIPLLLLLALFPPVMIGSESKMSPPAPEFVVRTSVEINAPPSRVWQNVVSFSQLPEPDELLFRSGIAYPIRAEIKGHGVGAVRHCVFSTGPFVEPVTIWDEPRLLEFSVTQNPSPMQELSPYSDLHPPHLDGFLLSHKGHFSLTPLPGSRTLLEGTTWYEHNLWPSAYWRIWSDFIIHRIHLRVLNHVKQLSETQTKN